MLFSEIRTLLVQCLKAILKRTTIYTKFIVPIENICMTFACEYSDYIKKLHAGRTYKKTRM